MSASSFHLPGSGSFSCFHGEKEKRPPLDGHALNGVHITHRIEELYHEAARRLPLGEIPDLADCVAAGGHFFGLAGPVANIILNAVTLLRHRAARGETTPPHLLAARWWYQIADRSESGLLAFMTAYFRYLHLASHDLALAVRLVRHDRLSPHHQRWPLLPDGGKLKYALRVAAVYAQHPAPDVLAGLMTAKYPAALLAPVLAKLRGTEPLTARDVSEIGDLLARQWPPYPPPADVEFRCRPDGVACTRADDGTLQLVTCIEEDVVVRIVIASTRNQLQSQQLGYISGLTFDNSADMETKLADCLQAAAAPVAVAVDYDASPCEHIISLKLCLLDAIHAFYIRAFAIMPRGAPNARLLRALLVAGHCYGPMDPASNIILSSVWYDAAFPHAQGAEVGLPDGIIDTKPMSRMGLRSLDGLVAIVCDTSYRSEHEALEYLNTWDCDLSRSYLVSRTNSSSSSIPFAAAAKAAKHPQHAAFGSFLMSLSLSSEKLNRLRCLLTAAGGISDAHWDELNAILVKESESVRRGSAVSVSVQEVEAAPCPSSVPFATPWTPSSSSPWLFPFAKEVVSPFASASASQGMFGKKPASESKLSFLRTELNKLLHKYCYQHPWEPSYRLDIICGVWESRNPCNPKKLYHANFLASTDDAITLPRERTLFFAELFESTSSEADQFRFGKEVSQTPSASSGASKRRLRTGERKGGACARARRKNTYSTDGGGGRPWAWKDDHGSGSIAGALMGYWACPDGLLGSMLAHIA